MTYPTGEQYEISSGDQRAVITEVGATLRSFQVGGRDVVRGFAADEVVHGGLGQQLLPWPNRIRDGRYTFEGTEQQPLLEQFGVTRNGRGAVDAGKLCLQPGAFGVGESGADAADVVQSAGVVVGAE